jgi:hypothetical protein
MTATSPLLKHMRAVRQVLNFTDQILGYTEVDRYCSGVALSANATLTAGHCISIIAHTGFVVLDNYVSQQFSPDLSLFPKQNATFKVFAGSASPSYSIPPFPAPPLQALSSSHAVGLQKSDAGFVYTWDTPASPAQSGTPVTICTQAPVVGQTIRVTGLKYVKNPDGSASLAWAEYPAKITQVNNADSEVFLPGAGRTPMFATIVEPSWTIANENSAMEFISEASVAGSCAEAGDSGGGVFLDTGTSVCLLGINSSRGINTADATGVQLCRPTLHRRITTNLLAQIPRERPTWGTFHIPNYTLTKFNISPRIHKGKLEFETFTGIKLP